ncbi:hypothetical protein [Cellulomonas sp. P24]|uniref:hypothetical protein n=1 Tax=Cellulomonas sp. P24 TaxID=2885206 RepID=UPI00216B1704|nr:hypothetical protein [Cellulomonas sp. P24]MCR6491449.1 hypothetical protein [Cellulomonas sp. P24]
MSDGVFLERGGELIAMELAPYDVEADLQRLLEQHPALLSGRQIDPDEPREWLLIAREQGLPGAIDGPDQWSVDHLFVDQAGVPTIVEVKRSTDTRIRREVVGQMLDYAANGVRYWPVERLQADLAARVGGQDEANSAVVELLGRAGGAVSVEAFWGQVQANLAAGRLRLLFVADVIPETLRRIIEFLNEQMTQCEVLGIEIRQYAADGHRVFTPTVIGQTSESRRTKRNTTDDRTFDQLLAAASVAVRDVERWLSDLARVHGWEVTTSKTGRQYRLPNNWTLVQLFPGDGGGSLQFMLGAVADAGLDEEARALLTELSAIAGRPLAHRQPWARVDGFHEHWEQFADEWLPRYASAVDRAATLLSATP